MIYFFMKNKDPHEYDDMLDIPYPYVSKHKRMDMSSRAAQFAPFAGVGHLDSRDGMESEEEKKMSEEEMMYMDPAYILDDMQPRGEEEV